jgi:hypothetical protein
MAYCQPQASLLDPVRRFSLPNGISLPNSAHKSVPFLYQFLVLTSSMEVARSAREATETALSATSGGGAAAQLRRVRGDNIWLGLAKQMTPAAPSPPCAASGQLLVDGEAAMAADRNGGDTRVSVVRGERKGGS